jgi:hypothetical protein
VYTDPVDDVVDSLYLPPEQLTVQSGMMTTLHIAWTLYNATFVKQRAFAQSHFFPLSRLLFFLFFLQSMCYFVPVANAFHINHRVRLHGLSLNEAFHISSVSLLSIRS